MAWEPEAQTHLFPSLTSKNQASASLHTCMCSIRSLQTPTHDGFQTYVHGWAVLNLCTPSHPSSPRNTHEYLFSAFKAGQGYCRLNNRLMAILTFCNCLAAFCFLPIVKSQREIFTFFIWNSELSSLPVLLALTMSVFCRSPTLHFVLFLSETHSMSRHALWTS